MTYEQIAARIRELTSQCLIQQGGNENDQTWTARREFNDLADEIAALEGEPPS